MATVTGPVAVSADALTEAHPEQQQAASTTHPELIAEKTIVRGFTKVVKDKDGKPQRKFVAKTTEAASKKLLEAGWEQFNQIAVIKYTVKSKSAAEALCPESDHYVRVFQNGVGYIQSTKSNALAIDVKEGTGVWIMAEDGTWTETIPPVPVNNDIEIDMRDIINTKPGKKKLSVLEQVMRFLKKLNLPDNQFQEMYSMALAQNAAQAAVLAESESDEDEEDEEDEAEAE